MSYTYLQGPGGVSSAESFSDIPAYVLLRLNLTADKSCCNDSGTESCQGFQSGMTCELSTGGHGAGTSISCAEASPARTSAPPEPGVELPENDLDCGPRWPGSLARYDPSTHLWKTRQCLLRGGLEPFSETWQNWGLMRDGECWEQSMPVGLTRGNASGLLPTPLADDWRGGTDAIRTDDGKQRMDQFRHWCKVVHGLTYPIPGHSEAVMGWPVGWSDLKPLGMDRFQEWQRLHGKCLRGGGKQEFMFCGHPFDQELLGVYGCPNCLGEAEHSCWRPGAYPEDLSCSHFFNESDESCEFTSTGPAMEVER